MLKLIISNLQLNPKSTTDSYSVTLTPSVGTPHTSKPPLSDIVLSVDEIVVTMTTPELKWPDYISFPDFNAVTASGHTSLHLAAALGHAEFVRQLLKHRVALNININAKDYLNLTPLHLAIKCIPPTDEGAWHTIITSLCEAGANVNSHTLLPNQMGVFATPLAQACGDGHFDLVRLLSSKYNAKDIKRDAINICLEKGNPLEVLNCLLTQLITCRAGKYEVAWMNIAFPSQFPFSWLMDALVTAYMANEGLSDTSQVSIPILQSQVSKIDVSGSNLEMLPLELFMFPNLEILFANHNKLEFLPLGVAPEEVSHILWSNSLIESKWQCINLKQLHLQGNRLKILPSCLFQLPKLRVLNVSDNCLISLPENIWISPQLQEFSCNNNNLTVLPTNTSYTLKKSSIVTQNTLLKNIIIASESSFLLVNRANTGTLPQQASMLPPRTSTEVLGETQLYLDVKRNAKIGHFLPDSGYHGYNFEMYIPKHEMLEDKLMRHNKLVEFDNDPLESSADMYLGLQKLHLANNELRRLPSDLPCLCPNMVELDVSFNMLSSVSIPFGMPHTLQQLKLSGNPLLGLDCSRPPPEKSACMRPIKVEGRDILDFPKHMGGYCSNHMRAVLPYLHNLKLKRCNLKSCVLFKPSEVGQQEGKGMEVNLKKFTKPDNATFEVPEGMLSY